MTFTLPGAAPDYAPDLSLEPKHTRIELTFDLDAKRAAACVTHTIRANRAGARTLRLDAVALDDVTLDDATGDDATGDGATGDGPAWRYDGEVLHLTWSRPFAAGEERDVTVRYSVQDPITGMMFSRPDEAYPDRPTHVWTDHETERARYWLPCVDYPSVRATFEFHLTAPSDMTILANGTLVGETEHGDGTKTAHWRLDQPCPSYLCCFGIGRFVRYDDEAVDGRPVAYFASPRFTPEQLHLSFGRTPNMLRWIQKRLGRPFPYPKYFQLAIPGIGGAMENISLVTWDDIFLLDEKGAAEFAYYVDAVNIHEMAHSYFGDDVVCRHFEHSWLKESWAVYIETAYWEEHEGRDMADYDLHVNATQYMDEADSNYVRPIVTRTYNSSWQMFDRHLYPGGAMRLHMLRHLVGDDAFWAATTDYLATYSGQVVETADFRRIMEKHAGLNLNRFFDQWIHGKGYPKLKASYKHDAEKNEATLTIEQTQADEKKGIGLFTFPLEIDVDDEAGTRALTVEIESDRHVVVFRTKGKPTQVRFDPRAKALFSLDFNPGDDMVKRTLSEAKRLRNRIWAAQTLIKGGQRASLRAVGEAMASEPFWGARVAVATALGKSGHVEAIEPLAAMLRGETDDKAKRGTAAACGRMRDPRLRQALLDFLAQDPPPFARMNALAALGAQRHEEDRALLEAETKRDDLHRLAAVGALQGLGQLKALDALEARLAYGEEDERSRHAAVEGYGTAARLVSREARQAAVDKLIDLTRDPNEKVRMRAGAALAGAGEARAQSALESLKSLHAKQDWPQIDRWCAKLRKGGPGEEAKKLQEQLEKLEERHRKLDERLQDLEAREG